MDESAARSGPVGGDPVPAVTVREQLMDLSDAELRDFFARCGPIKIEIITRRWPEVYVRWQELHEADIPRFIAQVRAEHGR